MSTVGTVVFIEEAWVGHRPIYTKLFNRTLLEMGCQVFTFCPKPRELEDWIVHNSQPKGAYTFFEYSRDSHPLMLLEEEDLLQKKLNMWKAAKQVVNGVVKQVGEKPDVVFFGVLDGYLTASLTAEVIDEIFPYPWSGIYFHPSHLRRHSPSWSLLPDGEQPHAGLYASQCVAIGILEEDLINPLQDILYGKPIFLFPDAINEVEYKLRSDALLLAQIKEQARGRKIVGLLGSLSKRKNIFKLVEIAKQMSTEDFFFVFGGQLFPKTFTTEEQVQLLELVSSNLENCFFYLNTIPEPEMIQLFSNCNMLFAVYDQYFHSSGTLARAATFKKPVVVSKQYYMGERVAKYNLGIGVNEEDNLEECIQAIRYLANHPLENPDYEGYLAANSVDKLPNAFQQILAQYSKSGIAVR